jgi:TonB family protein
MLRRAFLLAVASLTTAIWAQQPLVAVKEAVAPQYPPIAVAARVQGTVEVRIEIGSDGTVVKAEAIKGPAMLQTSAIQAAKKWKFAGDPETNRVSVARFIYLLGAEDDPDDTQIAFLPPDAIRISHRPPKTIVLY